MATIHQTTRTALSEIPGRLEAMHVATTPNNRLADEPTPANVLNTTIMDNPLHNISMQQDYNISPVPSPDEIVIKQRGRRRFTLSWSPEKVPTRSPFQKTPTKQLSTQMTLRSSPRKRLAMAAESLQTPASPANYSLTKPQSPSLLVSPRKGSAGAASASTGSVKMLWPGTPMVKKLRFEEKPIGQMSAETPLSVLLKGLSQDQLIVIIRNLVESDGQLEERVRNNFPTPDVGPMEDELMHIKRNIFKSLPTSRICKKTDSVAYARAATHLSAFKKTIINQTKLLHDSTHWDALLDYVTMAWNYVRATPIWDNNSHNVVRRQCFKVLSCHCVLAVKNGGKRLGAQRLYNLERNLKEWSKDYEDVISCVNSLDKTLAMFRTSL